VDTHVKRLRDKLGEAAQMLQTVRGIGFRLAESDVDLAGGPVNDEEDEIAVGVRQESVVERRGPR
jgi:DNA-binding winged helix-turn-helix (wHTH) protein